MNAFDLATAVTSAVCSSQTPEHGVCWSVVNRTLKVRMATSDCNLEGLKTLPACVTERATAFSSRGETTISVFLAE